LDDASGEEKLRRLKEMEEKGEIRMLKGMRRAMEYITDHPDIQLNLSLVVPVCARDSDGDEGLPIFFSVRDGCVKRRYLMPRKCKRTFPARYMWFVLRKRERV